MARRRRSLLLLFSLSFQVGSRVLPAAAVISLCCCCCCDLLISIYHSNQPALVFVYALVFRFAWCMETVPARVSLCKFLCLDSPFGNCELSSFVTWVPGSGGSLPLDSWPLQLGSHEVRVVLLTASFRRRERPQWTCSQLRLVFSSTKARKVAGLPCLAELLYATRDPSNTAILVQSNGKTWERERELKPQRETETEKATSCKESVQRERERS
jgi:hypothetical protein